MRIASVGRAFPRYHYEQSVLSDRLVEAWADDRAIARRAEQFMRTVGVDGRHLAMPVDQYGQDRSFGETNDLWIETALEIGEAAIRDALARAGLPVDRVDILLSTTVTGLASPSIDARLVNRMELRRDLKRVPVFGLGCVAGAAGISRLSDMLRGGPNDVAVLLSVELCSLTLQLRDHSIANAISACLFGDGATAAVVTGEDVPNGGPRILATRSVFYPDTEDVMGWKISEHGFEIVLSADVPRIVKEHLCNDVDAFLADNGLTRGDIGSWVCHPGGPKVIGALRESLDLTEEQLELTYQSLAQVGNLSSSSVLLVLRDTLLERRPDPGTRGMMIAMGPGFCSEMILLEW